MKIVIIVYLFKFSFVVCPQILQVLPVLIYPVGLRQLHMYSFSLERLLQQVLPVPSNPLVQSLYAVLPNLSCIALRDLFKLLEYGFHLKKDTW